jgi:L-fucose mutarotase/ribose pyranase (RbsD/FucU family)
MNRNNLRWIPPLTMAAVAGCATPQTSWKTTLATELPRLGHRNWIVIADSAYPLQTREGIQTVVTGADQIEVVKAVLDAVAKALHVRPVIQVDAELPYVSEKYAPGIDAYRAALNQAFAGRAIVSKKHEEIIKDLDEAGQTFKILLLKTNLTLPYTSVFIRLDCGYWSDEAQQDLLNAIAKAEKK